MNPHSLAVFLLIIGAAQLPAALLHGGHNGLTALGVTLVLAGIITQVAANIWEQKRSRTHE